MIDVEIRLTPRAKMVSGESRLPLTLLLKHRSNLHTCQLAKRNEVVSNNTYYTNLHGTRRNFDLTTVLIKFLLQSMNNTILFFDGLGICAKY